MASKKDIMSVVLSLLLLSCREPERPRPPSPPPDKACEAACQRREELKAECPARVSVTVQECTKRCNDAEALRPGITHATCVATSLDCKEMRDCAGEGH